MIIIIIIIIIIIMILILILIMIMIIIRYDCGHSTKWLFLSTYSRSNWNSKC